MWGAKRSGRNEGLVCGQDPGDRVDLGGSQCFWQGWCGKYSGQSTGEHGLSRAGRADHQQMVSAGCGDFEGALGVVLAADFREVDRVRAVFPEDVIDIEFVGSLSHIPF